MRGKPQRTDRLIIMTKYPEPGQTKTRLIPALGPQGAANLHRQFGLNTVAVGAEFDPEIRYAGGDETLMRDWLGDFQFVAQGDGDLGDRMSRAFADGFAKGPMGGCDRIVMIGTDCPGISPTLIQTAFVTLLTADLVLGPATDGGYYLIGLRSFYPQLFKTIVWSTETVLSKTLAIADRNQISYQQLIMLSDIDRPEDLALLL